MSVLKCAGCALLFTMFAAASTSVQEGSIASSADSLSSPSTNQHRNRIFDDVKEASSPSIAKLPPPPPPPPPKKSLNSDMLASWPSPQNRTLSRTFTGSANVGQSKLDKWRKEDQPSLFSIPKAVKDNAASSSDDYTQKRLTVHPPLNVPPPPPRPVITMQHDSMGGNWFSDTVVGRADGNGNGEPPKVPPGPPPILLRQAERQEISSREIKLPPPRQPQDHVRPDKLAVMTDTPLQIPPPPPQPQSSSSNVSMQQSSQQYPQGQVRPGIETTLRYPPPQTGPMNRMLVPRTYEQQQKYTPIQTATDPRQQQLPYRAVDPRFQQQMPLPQRVPPKHQPQGGQQHNWQQRQQQPRPSRAQHQPNRASEQQKAATSSLLTSLWKKVEKGLDGLADVENTVAGQAQQFIGRRKLLNSGNTASLRPQSRPSQPMAPQQRFQTRIENASIKTLPSKDVQSTRQIDWASVGAGRRVINSGGASALSEPATGAARSEPSRHAVSSTGNMDGRATSATQRYVSPPTASMRISKTAVHQQQEQPEHNQQQQQQLPKQESGDRRPAEFLAALQVSENIPTDSEQRRFPDEDDDDSLSLLDRIGRLFPRFPVLRRGRGLSGELAHSALEAWKADDEESLARKRNGWLSFFGNRPSQGKRIKEPLEVAIPATESLHSRVGSGARQSTVLKPSELRACRSIGGQKAAFDLLSVGFLILLAQQLQSIGAGDIFSVADGTTEALFRLWSCALESWAPDALACAFLSWQQGRNLARRKEVRIINEATESAMVDANYGAMMLRLTKGSPIDQKAIALVLLGVRSQISAAIGIARLKTFAFVAVLFIGMLWGPDFRPILANLGAVLTSLTGFVRWPIDISSAVSIAQSTFAALWRIVKTLVMDFVTAMLDHPVLFSFKTAIGVSLIVVSFVPGLIRQKQDSDITDTDDDDQDDRMLRTVTEQLDGFGASGANRLNLMAGSLLESLLDRWIRLVSSPRTENIALQSSIKFIAQKFWFWLLSSAVLLAPFSFYSLSNFDARSGNTASQMFGSLLDLSCVFAFAQILVWDAISKVSVSARLIRETNSFLESCTSSIDERKRMTFASMPSIDFIASISPKAGMLVSNMWASFATKRAWALRGVSFACQKGEVVVVLSCDSSSKSHLIRAIAESLTGVSPASCSFIPAQGTLSFGGLDVKTWDKNLLRKRVGVLLNDVRSTSDFAQVLSGLSLEEILYPCIGLPGFGDAPGERERSAMILALQLTGLYTSLLPRLPSKLATTVTANEEDLRASSLRPRCEFLSPAEWRKLLLARVLANMIYNNENSATASGSSAANSLVGTTLIIEDFSSYLSEADEARLISNLRQTGAACVFTTERWATGRFANKVVIMRDGAIVEAGSHEELMSKGVQKSIYAAQAQSAFG